MMKQRFGINPLAPVAPYMARADRLADSVVIVLSMTAVQRLIGFARSVLFCLWLSIEDLGQWDMAFSFLTLAVPIAVLSLPGSFGRYVAYYRQRGQLRTFLRRTLTATALLALTAGVVLTTNRAWFSSFIFGRDDRADFVLALAFSLLAMIAYGVVAELLVALRMQRLASGLELFNTVAFAALAAALVVGWQADTRGIVIAYGTASLLSALVALVWIYPWWHALPASEGPHVGQLAVWTKIVPFAAALWLSNGLANLFSIAERYILVHYSGQDAASSLAMVGEYHGSRIVPTLLVTVCGLLATVTTPFLSHEWEAGPKSRVSCQLNLLLKLTGMGLLAAATAILFLSPLLFGWMFNGKFRTAPAVLSLALAYCCWSGLAGLAKVYLWCAEKAMLVSLAYGLGLMASIGMNLLLVPRFGIYGAAEGTCVAQVVLLLLIYGFSRAYGLELHPATCVISALPLALALGPWAALTALAFVCTAALAGNLVFNPAEKREIAATLRRYRAKLRRSGATVALPETSVGNALCGVPRPTDRSPMFTPRNATEGVPYRTRPLRVMFIHTSLFVGGAEALLVDLIRRLDRDRFSPEVCCLKESGPFRERLPGDVPVFHNLIGHKYDATVVLRLARLFRSRQVDAIVTLGAGDRMFWGRLAAWLAGVRVITAWIHSTGWPDRLGTLNRLLTPITDAFIGVAHAHGRYLVDVERLPVDRVYVVENGVDIERFRPQPADTRLRSELGLPASAPVAGIVARLSEEKNHELFLRVAALVREQVNDAHFLIVGDGPQRDRLEALARQLGIDRAVYFLGNRSDVPELLALLDVFLLTSHVEANPVSILEALATGKPVVATRVGSVGETVHHGVVGYLVEPGNAEAMAGHVVELLQDPRLARRLGAEGRRQVVDRYSMSRMVECYQDLLEQLFASKAGRVSTEDALEDEPLPIATPLLSSEG